MQPLNLSFRRLLYRKLGKLKPKDVEKFERLTALRHQLSEESRLSICPSDPDLVKTFKKHLSIPRLNSKIKNALNNRISNKIPNKKLTNAIDKLDKDINSIFFEERDTLTKLHRTYIKNRKIALKQNLFFQHPFKKYW